LMEIKAEHSITIKLPVREVFAYVSNLETLADWSSPVLTINSLSPEVVGVGTVVKITFQFLNLQLDTIFEVVEHDPDRCLTIKSTSGMSPCLFCYRFESAEGDGTQVSRESLIQVIMDGSGNLSEPEIISAVHDQLRFDLQTLKDILEARSLAYEIVS
jgi:uncharacterized membrane protein